MTGFTLPGMIDEPFCSSGSRSSERPARGPEPISARSLAILIIETATTLSAPESSTSASRLAWASKRIAGRRDLDAHVLRDQVTHLPGELGMRIEAGAGRRATQGQLSDAPESRANPLSAEARSARHIPQTPDRASPARHPSDACGPSSRCRRTPLRPGTKAFW